jgi:hypothetical protein
MGVVRGPVGRDARDGPEPTSRLRRSAVLGDRWTSREAFATSPRNAGSGRAGGRSTRGGRIPRHRPGSPASSRSPRGRRRFGPWSGSPAGRSRSCTDTPRQTRRADVRSRRPAHEYVGRRSGHGRSGAPWSRRGSQVGSARVPARRRGPDRVALVVVPSPLAAPLEASSSGWACANSTWRAPVDGVSGLRRRAPAARTASHVRCPGSRRRSGLGRWAG